MRKKINLFSVLIFIYILMITSFIILLILGSNSIKVYTDYSEYKRDICYVYMESKVITGRFGATTDISKYFNYGIVLPDGTIESHEDLCNKNKYWEDHPINISDKDYILYSVRQEKDENGEVFLERIIGYEFYLTKDTLKQIG